LATPVRSPVPAKRAVPHGAVEPA